MAAALISPSIALADANPDVVAITIVRPTLDVFVNVLSFLFLCRTIISWYPKTDLTKLPYSAVVWPTEPLLVPVRGLIPPAFGVDISAIVWIMLLQFVREITIGQQGILTLLENS
jgi:YggT family protein